jgi:hypothetical protein
LQHAAIDLEGSGVAAGFLGEQRGHAAHPIAAGAGLGAVAVVDPHERVGASLARRIKRHELVVGRVRRLRRRARLVGVDGGGNLAHVHHHDRVAETVHLHECAIAERAHISTVRRTSLIGLGYMGNVPTLASGPRIRPRHLHAFRSYLG